MLMPNLCLDVSENRSGVHLISYSFDSLILSTFHVNTFDAFHFAICRRFPRINALNSEGWAPVHLAATAGADRALRVTWAEIERTQ